MQSRTAEEAWRAWARVPVRVGSSSCLLGNLVRFDGGHARARYVTDVLADHAELITVCPEVEMGMSTPRPTVRLIEEPVGEIHLVDPRSGEDWTARAEAHARQRVAGLVKEDLDGFVLKKDSPSCGMERVKAWTQDGRSRGKRAMGVFARILKETLPDLPVEEDGRLNDPLLRETFLERVWAGNRLRGLLASDPAPRDLVAFHTAHKILLGTHDDALYREAGRVVARAGTDPFSTLLEEYGVIFKACLRKPATRGKHVNAMQHLLGHFGDLLPGPERQRIVATIEEYRSGTLPLMAPLSLLRFLCAQFGLEWPLAQLYLSPFPKELAIRTGG